MRSRRGGRVVAARAGKLRGVIKTYLHTVHMLPTTLRALKDALTNDMVVLW